MIAHLAPGERLLWQGSPAPRRFALEALGLPWVALYVVALVGFCFVAGAWNTAAAYAMVSLAALGLLATLGYAMAGSTTYSLTTSNLMIEYGVALPKSVSIPYRRIAAVGLRLNADGSGDLVVRLDSNKGLGGPLLWPHIRPWRLRAEPALRAIPAAETAADILRRQLAATNPDAVMAAGQPPAAQSATLAVAAE